MMVVPPDKTIVAAQKPPRSNRYGEQHLHPLALAELTKTACSPQKLTFRSFRRFSVKPSRARRRACERILVMQTSQHRFGKHKHTCRQSMSGFES
jgi:hypothetical protein